MFSNSRKKISPSKLAPATSQQLPPWLPRHQLPSPPESQSHPPQQQRQSRPVHPWSILRPTFRSKDVPPSTSPPPFPRYGHTLSTTAADELLFFGGFAHGSLRNDLYVFSTRDCSATFLKTSGEVPSPRFSPVGVLVNNFLLIFSGATKLRDRGFPTGHDDSLYLLSLASREWTRLVVNGPRPVGRHGMAVTMVGSKLFIFGGRTDRGCLNDMWAFDLNSLNSNPVWNLYEPTPGDEKPPPRTSHVLVSTSDCIILFGGTDGRKRHNDTWLFDISTRKWTELRCTGSIPSPRYCHAAALVDDVMYVFGGLDVDGRDLGDLIGLNLSTQQWFMLQKMGPSPGRRSDHAMVSNGTRIFMVGGKLAAGAEDESALFHVLETKHIENLKPDPNAPNDKTTKPALKSSAGLSAREQPQYPTSSSSSSDAYVAHNTSIFQNSTPEELGRPTSLQITLERNPSPDGLPSQPTSVNGKIRRVPEKDDDGEGSAEYRLDASSEGEVARLECERVVELEQQMSAMLAERDQRLAQLTEELALKSSLLERAEANAAEATKRAGPEPREHADRLLGQTSLVEHKDAELVKMRGKLDELILSRDRAQSALQIATSRAAVADERSQRASEQYETELAEVRAELKAGRSELEAVRLRLTEAEIGWAKSKAEADTLRTLTTAGLVGADEDRMTRGILERIRAMEDEMASQRWSEKSFEALETRNEG